jgi:predicted SprT family Zn-dependent metalloprotease
MLQQRKQMVLDKVAQLIAQANTKYRIVLPNIDVRFDLRGRCAGIAGRQRGQWMMRFNTDMMQNEGWDHLYNDTVPHELAHVVCMYEGTDRGHGRAWRNTCIELGGSGARCHNEKITYANGKTYYYTSSTGKVIELSVIRHRKVQSGGAYRWRDGSRIDRQCAWSTTNPAMLVAAPAPTTPAAKVVQSTGSKAERLRAKIAELRASGLAEALQIAAATNYAIDQLGLTKTLAATYVRNNWNKG